MSSTYPIETYDGHKSQDGPPTSLTSTTSPPLPPLERAIYPENSILSTMMDYARQQSEASDSYLIGASVAAIAATLARNVWFPWGAEKWYPNLYVMLVGRAGDRKSHVIRLTRKFLADALPPKRFLSSNCSKEALFDEYDSETDGAPDKLLLVEEGNQLMSSWKSGYGEQVGSCFLDLYDCCSLDERFKRNQKGDDASTSRRHIKETSTSLIAAATYNACQFTGQQIQNGINRRFLFFVSKKLGRTITRPPAPNYKMLEQIQTQLWRMTQFREIECFLSKDAENLWDAYQVENRQRLERATTDQDRSRLNSSPNHVMRIAMVFAASKIAKEFEPAWNGEIDARSLGLATDFIDQAIDSATALDAIVEEEPNKEMAEAILARVRTDYRCRSKNGRIPLSRTDLTRKFASHPGRPNSISTKRLYDQIIPEIERQGNVKVEKGPGKETKFTFTTEYKSL